MKSKIKFKSQPSKLTRPKLVNPAVAIKLNKVFFRYRRGRALVLQDINLEVRTGQYVTIIGHNGSGKSTLAKLMTGIFRCESGEIEIFGTKLTSSNIDDMRQFLGIIFQNPDNQFIGSTVEDDIAFGLENRQVDPKAMPEIIEKCARLVNMEKYLTSEPLMLSGGQKQKVAIASALALSAEIIIFDEATSMLDSTGEQKVRQLMKQLRTNEHKTIISITHNIEEALESDVVIVLNQGQVAAMGDPKKILNNHQMLRSIHLEVPMTSQIALALQRQGIPVKTTTSETDLLDQIIKLR